MSLNLALPLKAALHDLTLHKLIKAFNQTTSFERPFDSTTLL